MVNRDYYVPDLSAYMKNSIELNSIICLHLSQIGELCKKLPDSFKENHTSIAWKSLYRTRNIIAHDYDAISYGIVADIIYSQVLPLRLVLMKVTDS
ncbi:MAG: HepT-like ribonuclease domain-containing protein [Paenibacillaceae bacterium]